MHGVFVIRLAAVWLGSLAVCAALDPSSEPLALRYLAILERNPTSETAAERLWELYSASGETDLFLTKLRGLSERDPLARIPLATFLQRSGKLAEAESSLAGLSIEAMDAKSLIRAGRLWGLIGKPDLAVAAWEKAVTTDPQNMTLRGEIAGAYLDAGNPRGAIEHWEILARDSTASERLLALENLSTAHEAAGDPSQSAFFAKEALNSLAPGHWKLPELIERTISLHEKAGELDALEIEWAGSMVPGLAVRMAALSKRRGDTIAQAKWLSEASAADPKNSLLLRDLATAELANNNRDNAEAALRKRHAMGSGDEDILEDLASFLADEGQEDEALTLITSHYAQSATSEAIIARKIALLRKLNFRDGLTQALRASFEQSKDSLPAAKELATHLLEQGSPTEAVQVVKTLDQSTPAKNRAEIRRDVSRFWYDMQVPAESALWARKALELEPNNQESILLLADILEAKGDILPALDLIEQSAPPSADLVPMELDQRLFSLLQLRDSEADPALRNIGTKAFLQALLENDGGRQSADRLIRASRWAAWTGDSASAVTSLRAALNLRTDSPELLDRLAGELEKLGDFHEAALVLWRLDALTPDPTTKIRIARMEVARGEAETAVTLLAEAAAESPNDTNLARELAMAREAAGQNFEALESWLRAFELSPPPEKQNLSKSVLKSFSRLSLVDRGLEFLVQTAPRLPDDRLRLEFLRDGTTFARENQVLERWQAILESQARQPSVAWKMALSELQPEGPAPEPADVAESAEAIELLLQDAEAKRDYDRATVLSGKLAARPEAGPQEHLRHLGYLEITQPADQTETAWNKTLQAFPRSQEVQLAAAGFFRRQGNETREVEQLRAASQRGPLPAQVLLRMARSPGNDKATAFEDYMSLLQRIPPDPTPSRNPPPLPKDISRLPGLVSLSETDPQACRLLAIREVGQLLQNSPTKRDRLDSLTESAPMERVWGYWGAGEQERALDLLLAITDPANQKSFDMAFVALGLDAMSLQRLQSWAAAGETLEERWMLITDVLTAMISPGWSPDINKLQTFLEKSPAFVRLRTSEALAAAGLLRAAIALGIPSGLPPSLEAEARFRLAGWKFTLRDPEGATSELTRCLALNTPSSDFQNLNFSALRAGWLLNDAKKREAFEEAALTRAREHGSPWAAHATEALFFALRGERENFCRVVALWLDQPTDGAVSPGLLALNASATFENWNLPARARDILRSALDQNATRSALGSELGIGRALENAIITSLLMESHDATSKYLINEWVARGAKREELAAAGARAAGTGRIATAKFLHEKVFEMQPMNPTSWIQLLALRPWPEGKSNLPADWFIAATEDMRSQISGQPVLQLASALTAEGNIPKALEFLQAVPEARVTPPILEAKDHLLIQLGQKPPKESPAAPEDQPTEVPESSEKILATKKSMEEQWKRDWAAGSLKSGEALVGLAIEKNDEPGLQSLIRDLINHPQAKPKDLAAFAKILMENRKFAEAVSVFSRLDEFGIPVHSQALSYAEALWKTGRRADAIEIAEAFNQTSRVDPALRLSLAAFYLSVDRPDAAIFQMDQPGQSFVSAQKAAPLRAAAGALLLARDRLNDAKVQITIAAQVPNATPPDLVADFYERLGKGGNTQTGHNEEGQANPGGLFELSPSTNEFALRENDLRAFRWVVAQRAFAAGLPDVGLAWLTIDPALAASPEARRLVAESHDASPEALKSYWTLNAESPWLEARLAAKTFFEEAGINQTKPRP